MALLRSVLKVDDFVSKEIMKRRLRPFLVDNERWKTPRIRTNNNSGGQQQQTIIRMPRSKKNGHFREKIILEKTGDVVDYEAILPDDDDRQFSGKTHILPEKGLSIISDIDDTIKITNVTDKKAMLSNTFLKEFRDVPGMAKLYSQWKDEFQASFHFVSSSPWQLYKELATFMVQKGFPEPASFHLKSIRVKDRTLLNLFADPIQTKTKAIRSIIDRFPHRSFVLVGDSGEKDPEVYGQLARAYPLQILKIYIRDVSTLLGDDDDDEIVVPPFQQRMHAAFEGLEAQKWEIFDDPLQIKLSMDDIP